MKKSNEDFKISKVSYECMHAGDLCTRNNIISNNNKKINEKKKNKNE